MENKEMEQETMETVSENEATPTIEERFERLDGIVSRMDEENVPLEEAFALYKEGLEQVKFANAMLDEMEAAIRMLDEDGDLEDFE